MAKAKKCFLAFTKKYKESLAMVVQAYSRVGRMAYEANAKRNRKDVLKRFGSALDALSDKLMIDDKLILDLLKYTRRRGPGEGGAKHVVSSFDTIYQGNYGELVQAVWFALDTNYGAAIRRRFFGQGGAE